MKFVCDRCQTRYSIADEKVRQKILKIRCKTCDNVITVRENAAGGAPAGGPASAPLSMSVAPTPSSAQPRVSRASSAVPPAPTGGLSKASVPPPRPTPPPPRVDPGPVEWFLAVNGQESGPFSRVDLAKKLLALKPDDDAHVWKEGFDGWKPPRDVPEVAREMQSQKLRSPLPAPPPPPPARRPPAPAAKGAGAGAGASGGTAAPVAELAPARASASMPIAKAAQSEAFEEVDERTQIQGLDAALLAGEAAAARHGLDAAKGAKPGAHVNGNNGHANGSRPSAGANGTGTGLEGLDLGGGGGGGGGAFFPPPQPALAMAGGGVAVSAPAAAGVTGNESGLSKLIASTSLTGNESGLSKLMPAVGRNPAIKYVAAAGGVIVLIVGVVIATMGGSDPKPASATSKPAPSTAPKPPEDPEAAARERARQFFGDDQANTGGTKAVVGQVPGAKTIPGKKPAPGAKPTGPGPLATAPPPVSTEPPPPDQSGQPPERRVSAFGERNERALRMPTSTASGPSGDVPQEKISAVITSRTNQDQLKTCYNRALRHDGTNIKGRMDVSVTIGASGKVKSVSASSPPDLNAVHGCVKQAVGRWLFPASREEYSITFPLLLQGGG